MVWFQCEDCGENLKKPKLPNHFRICTAIKLSCIDCGKIFTKESVQCHTQCMTEAEKYGPKDQGKPLQNGQNKPEKPKKNADVDINVGLSSRPPWLCSLCNTNTTSQQTLQLHADGKKHRAKAKAFHAAQNQSDQNKEKTDEAESVEANASKADEVKEKDIFQGGAQPVIEKKLEKKRKHNEEGRRVLVNENERDSSCNPSEGEVIEAEEAEENGRARKKNNKDKLPHNGCVETSKRKIKWKKLVTSTLKMNSDGVMKIKKLQKLVIKELKESGVPGDEGQLFDAMMNKITTSSRFAIDKKLIRLAEKTKE